MESWTNINNPIKILENEINDATVRLPEDIFLFVSKITPLINVDVLIKDENGRILLSWRGDRYTENGWHFPGRIVRFKNTLKQTVYDLVDEEIKTRVVLSEVPLEYNEIIEDHSDRDNIRSHFISFLYEGFLDSTENLFTKKFKENDCGYLKWFDYCPDNLISCQKKIYSKYFKRDEN